MSDSISRQAVFEMSEPIDRRKTIEHIKKRLVETALNNIGFNEDVYLDIADHRIETWVNEILPSARPKIIQCKDCYHYPSKYADCPMIGWARNENDFCSKAERKDDEFCGRGERRMEK